MIAVYKKLKSLPSTKTDLYDLFVDLLSGGWDLVKGVHRDGRFGPQDKVTMLTRLAAHMHLENKRTASEHDLRAALKDSLPAFVSHWQEFVTELLADGLLISAGTDYTFCHFSFQEFLVARDLNDPSGRRPTQAVKWFYLGDDWWRGALEFYIPLAGRPAETERWLIESARSAAINATNVLTGDLQMRFIYLRKVLAASFPAFKPRALATIAENELFGILTRYQPKDAMVDGLDADSYEA